MLKPMHLYTFWGSVLRGQISATMQMGEFQQYLGHLEHICELLLIITYNAKER